MSRRIQAIPSYVKNPKIVEFLKIQLDLTNYEVLAFVSIIFGNEQPSLIADEVNIPRSKIYATIESLIEKRLIVKNESNFYRPNPEIFDTLVTNARASYGEYLEFLNTLTSYSKTSARIKQSIINEMLTIFKNNNYRILNRNEFINEDLKEIYERMRYGAFRAVVRRDKIIGKGVPQNDYNTLISNLEFIGESNNSGIRIGTSILENVNKIESIDLYLNTLNTLEEILSIQYFFIVLAPGVSPNFVKPLEKEISVNYKNYIIYEAISNYREKLDEYIKNVEKMWRDNRETLNKLGSQTERLKDLNRDHLVDLNKLLAEITYPSDLREVYEDMFFRIKRDLQNYDDLLFTLEEQINSSFNRLSRKIMIPQISLKRIEDELATIERSVNEKYEEVNNYRDELIAYRSDKNIYEKYGYAVNPFSLKVPTPTTDTIINQEKSKKIINDYIESIYKGTDNNLLFILANEGGGKSHMLNYFDNQINKEKYGKNISLRIECRPRADLIDLYPQITTQIRKVSKNLGKTDIDNDLSLLLTEIGTPRTISDLINIIKNISILLNKNGFSSLYIFLDEFENTLPTAEFEDVRRGYIERSSRMSTPETIIQLDSLTQLGYVGFIVTMRRIGWERWKKQFRSRINKIYDNYIVTLDKFNEKSTKEFINYRLNKYKIGNPINTILFSDEVINKIQEKSEGNPRIILRLCEKLFRKAVNSGELKIKENI